MLENFLPRALPGDRAPPCYGMSPGRVFYSSEEQYGRPAVLILLGTEAALPSFLSDLPAALSAFAARTADVYIMLNDNPDQLFGRALATLPIRAIDCGSFLSRCGVSPNDAAIMVLDRNLRIALRIAPDDTSDIVNACLQCLDNLPFEAPRAVTMPAPAIVLPNILPRGICRHLIDLFEASPSIDGAVARIDAAGNVCSIVDHDKKSRRDLMIEQDSELHRMLSDVLLYRCAPEIAKAFQVHVTHIDRILLSRYDMGSGWFRRHRDNAAENVAFRQFAMSINLNAGDYEGGHLLFPEYNDHTHLPPTGAGVIFSSAVLHEAAPVTNGHRYVLLSFLHDDTAEARRVAELARTAVP